MHAPPYSSQGSSSRRGGISGNSAKPTIASPVMIARLLRQTGNTPGRFQKSTAKMASVTTKWATP